LKANKITVCGGGSCRSQKSDSIFKNLKKEVKAAKLDVTVEHTGCHGMCEVGPLVVVGQNKKEILYTKVTAEDAKDIVNSAKKGTILKRLIFEHEEDGHQAYVEDIDFYKYQTRYVMRRTGQIDPYKIKHYLGTGGFEGLKLALVMKPEEVIAMVKESNLRGRGGAGFNTGMKWSFIAREEGERILIANADEGDPGSFMDRTLMEGDPFAVIEGMTIAAWAVGSEKAHIYVRAEYPDSIKTLTNAINEAKKEGFLGKNICGIKGFNFDIEIFEGAGAFICGEETALISSLEGKRGMPRPKPPFPAQNGVYGKPTNINNVKTYAYVSHILREGPESFKQYGTEKSPGTAVLCLTGKIKHTGVVEVPMGISLHDIVYKIGGGIRNNKKLKAVLTGGPSGGCIPADKIKEVTVDYESITAAGSIMGSGGMLILDEDDNMVEIANFFVEFTKSESCGKCTPCREGTYRMYELLQKISKHKAKQEDLDNLKVLAKYIQENSLCGLGQSAPNPVLTTIKHFGNEYDDKIKNKKPTYFITESCTGCGLCAKKCPVQCISGKIKQQHTIDQSKCIHCGICYKVCPTKAIIIEK